MKKQKSNKRKIFCAAASLFCSIAILTTSTYAWLTMNKEVSVTNMELKVKTSSNLLVSPNNDSDATYVTSLEQSTLKALLEPTSTVDGINYYYTLDGAADGHKIHGPDTDNPYVKYDEGTALKVEDTFASKTKYDAAFNTAYGIQTANPTAAAAFQTAYGYIDYTLYLKANTTAANQKIVLNKCNLLYQNTIVTEKAWRMAMLVQETTLGQHPTSDGTLKTIIGLSGAENQTANKAVNSTTTIDSVTNANAAAIVADNLAANITKYYKVVIRVWIEGEDTTCTSEVFGKRTDSYSLDLKFSIDDTATPITTISSIIE